MYRQNQGEIKRASNIKISTEQQLLSNNTIKARQTSSRVCWGYLVLAATAYSLWCRDKLFPSFP